MKEQLYLPNTTSEILDLIHDIAAKASSASGIPPEVDKALDEIIALSRYKFNVLNKRNPNENP